MKTRLRKKTEIGVRFCVACGEIVEDETQDYCDSCLDDETLRIRDMSSVSLLGRDAKGLGLVSRYDFLI